MRKLLEYAMRGRSQAILVATGCFALSALLTPGPQSAVTAVTPWFLAGLSIYASGAVIGLSTLKAGAREGLFVGLGVLLGASLVALAAGTGVGQVAVLAILNWLPAVVAANLLRKDNLQGSAFSVIGLMAVLAWLGYLVLNGPPALMFEPWLRDELWPLLVANLEQSGHEPLPAPDFAAASKIMGEVALASLVMGMVLTTLLARWWHAVLDNPNGFGKEFRELRMPNSSVYTVVAALFVGVASTGWVAAAAGGVVAIAMVLFNFQGIAVVHAIVHQRKGPRSWLVAFYVFYFVGLPIVPYSPVLLAVVGFADSWFDYRKRAART
jgi:hypothetical protein